MQTGLRNPVAYARPLDVAMDGGRSTRGFWTKRKRTAASLFVVLGLVAGIAVAYKLFDQTVPNNVVRDAGNFKFRIEARDLAAGEVDFREVVPGDPLKVIFRSTSVGANPKDVNTFPGDARRTDVRITNINDPSRDASFYVAVEQIKVFSWNGGNSYSEVIPTSSLQAQQQFNRFVSFWTLQIQKQTYVTNPGCTKGDCAENDPEEDTSFANACGPTSINQITRTNLCKLGIIRAAGTQTGPAIQDFSDDRQFRFIAAEADDGSDQSQFKGWRVSFTLAFLARVPPEAETSRGFPV